MEGGKLARRLLLLRSWERQHMPMAGSVIAGDIVLLALAREDGDAARVKDFHLSLHYSEDRVSQVLKALVRDGWLTMERDEDDRRIHLRCQQAERQSDERHHEPHRAARVHPHAHRDRLPVRKPAEAAA